ncbi:ferredoxin family protein [Metabacillus fastidiosus]|uniref:ferredoxin family protein n=1 Tax=Metabacillus fastidiosus TaxID=1458 RepID=UPI002DBFFDB9|nr:ferredoxin family protein [Metabacillus fastidiosus]MEC2078176.1 ferredoxin family protein [Metabacillus fastidiosus]
MIEIINTTKCVECNICVSVCPTNVFDKVENDTPIIARQTDCQTCFMCELYCPADALYVAPEAEVNVSLNEDLLEEQGLIGDYRKKIGWGRGRKPVSSHEYMYELYKRTSF